MDSEWVNTSLGLNVIPFHPVSDDQAPVKKQLELEGDYAKVFEGHASVKQEAAASLVLTEELNRISLENKKLTEMLTALCENYTKLQSHVKELMITKQQSSDQNDLATNFNKKRKPDSEDYNNMIGLTSPGTNTETSSISDEEYPCKKPKENSNLKISRVYVRTEASDTRLIVKDGYQWRKYGQKVTRDNPSPRAYYKCSFAPSCPVKKKVQKSAENPCVLVATYEGEHNHIHTETRAEVTLIGSISPNQQLSPLSVLPSTAKRTLPVSTFSGDRSNNPSPREIEGAPTASQQFLVQQMASSLAKDPNFASTLAAAISERFADHSRMGNW